MVKSIEYVFFRGIRSQTQITNFPISQLKQFNLAFITQSLQIFPFSQSKQSCFLCRNFIPINGLVQSIENLPDTVFPSDSGINSFSFIILCSSK